MTSVRPLMLLRLARGSRPSSSRRDGAFAQDTRVVAALEQAGPPIQRPFLDAEFPSHDSDGTTGVDHQLQDSRRGPPGKSGARHRTPATPSLAMSPLPIVHGRHRLLTTPTAHFCLRRRRRCHTRNDPEYRGRTMRTLFTAELS